MLRRHIGNYNFVGDAKTGITCDNTPLQAKTFELH